MKLHTKDIFATHRTCISNTVINLCDHIGIILCLTIIGVVEISLI